MVIVWYCQGKGGEKKWKYLDEDGCCVAVVGGDVLLSAD